MVRYGLLLVAVLVVLLPGERRQAKPFYAVDFFYSLMLFLLVVVLVLGSFAVKMISQSNYPIALAQTLMGLPGFCSPGLVVESAWQFFRCWPFDVALSPGCGAAF